MKNIFKGQNLFFYLTCFLLVFIPLYPKIPLFPVKGTYVQIRFDDIAIALVILLWGLYNIKNLFKLARKNIVQAFLLFWFVGAVGTLAGIFISHTVSLHLGFLHWLRRIEMMMLFFIAASSIKSVKRIKIVLILMVITTLATVIYGFGQIYLNFPVISTGNSEFSKGQFLRLTPGARVSSTFAGPYDLAMYLSFILIFLGTMMFYYKKITARIIMAITGFVSFILLGYTAARLAYVGTVVGLMASFWILGKRLIIVLLIAISIVGAIAIPSIRTRLWATVKVVILKNPGVTYALPSPSAPALTREQAATMSYELILKDATKDATLSGNKGKGVPADVSAGESTNYADLEVQRSANIRLQVEWPRAVQFFEANPVLGSGYSSLLDPTTKGEASDNDYLRSIGETGILGTLSLILIFGILVRKLWSAKKATKSHFEKLFIVATLCSLIMLAITAVFFDVLEASKIAVIVWILLGIAWAAASDYEGI